MTRTLALLALLLGGCGDEPKEPQGDGTARPAAQSAMAPIDESNLTSGPIAAREPAPPVQPRPVISRETPTHRPVPAAPYRAIGTEPFWAVIVRGSTATLERPDHPPRRFSVREDVDDKAIRYQGDGFAMTLTPGPCSDGMSDAIWSDRVQVAFGDGVLKGCGGERDDGDLAN